MKKEKKSLKAKKQPVSKKELWTRVLLISAAVILSLWTLFAVCLLTIKLMTYGPVWDEMSDLDYNGEYTTHLDENGTYYVVPNTMQAGFVFYAGGLVEHAAYLPFMEELASRGILCVMPKFPLNLALLDVDAAAGIKGEYADKIAPKDWYIGGHSLGGVAAAEYYSKYPNEFYGIVLIASYSTVDLTKAMCVLSIYGSEDQVLNMKKYEKNKENLPSGLLGEFIIEGGNHSGFGAYGQQRGDGEAKITPTEQRKIAADRIAKFMIE